MASVWSRHIQGDVGDPKSESSGQGGLKYIKYIEATHMPQSLWNS